MEENIDKRYLPYGSVVKLKEDKRQYMIIGLQVEVFEKENQSNKYYFDYSSIMLPKGYTGEKELVLFNAKDIETVVFNGFMDKNISTYYDDIKWEVDRREKNEE